MSDFTSMSKRMPELFLHHNFQSYYAKVIKADAGAIGSAC
jgi:hypothetical protein